MAGTGLAGPITLSVVALPAEDAWCRWKSASHDESYAQGSVSKPTLFARRVPSHTVAQEAGGQQYYCQARYLAELNRRKEKKKSALFCMMPVCSTMVRNNSQNPILMCRLLMGAFPIARLSEKY